MRGLNRVALILSSAAILAAEPLRLAAQIGAADTRPAPSTQAAPTTQPTTQSSFVQGVPTVINPGARHGPPTTQIAFNFKDASIDAILDYLSQTAGYIVIKDAPVSGRVSVESKEPVTPDEAVTLLQSVLKTNGFTIIQMDRVLKVTTFDKAKKQNIPVMQGEDPKLVPITDQLVTWVIPIKSVDAIKLKADLQPLIGPDADLSANGGSNSIIMTDTSANIHRIVQIVANLDQKTANESTILIQQLQHADAAAVAKLITDLFKVDTQTQGQNGGFNPATFFRSLRGGGGGGGGGRFGGGGGGFPGGGGGAAAQQEEGNLGKVLASSDQRTNTVVVTGPPDTLDVIKKMLVELDKPASEQTFFIYPVKNGTAVDIANTLNAMFTGSGSTSTGGGANTSNRLSSNGGSSSRSGSSGFGSSGSSGFGSSGGSGGSSGFGGGSNINRNSVIGGTGGTGGGGGLAAITKSGSGGAASPLAELLGQVYVVPDQDTNSLLIATATKYEKEVRDVLATLDRPVPQVLIKVLIAEVTHDNSLDVGADWSILNLNARNGGKAGLTLGSSLGNATAGSGLTVSLVEDNLTATLHALATAGKVDVLSRPYILTSDNQPAEIVIGSEVPIITNSQLTDTGQQINTVQYRDIGIILDVTPHINPEGLVICDVSPEVSATTDQSTPIASNVSAPVFSLRSANTRVGIKDGTTIVIGGLMQDQKTSTVNKIPILGDIPLIGPVFARTQVSKTKTELLFFITPHVAQSPDRLQPMSQDEMKGTKLTPRAVQPGVYGEQMRGMQLGGSTTQPVPLISPAGAGPNETQRSVNPTAPLIPTPAPQ
jgi:general secretion pathway protein D